MSGIMIGLIGALVLAILIGLVRIDISWNRSNDQRTPREWLFVHAYGPEQSRPGYRQTYSEALEFMREALQGRFVRVDFDKSIIFFDARKLER